MDSNESVGVRFEAWSIFVVQVNWKKKIQVDV